MPETEVRSPSPQQLGMILQKILEILEHLAENDRLITELLKRRED